MTTLIFFLNSICLPNLDSELQGVTLAEIHHAKLAIKHFVVAGTIV